MLKRLELVGFKSFADKTRFDFHEGITAIVGPNGSGKSNIVDAVRWILGEQSAKSLRGGEMADVIFTGSASRRGLGMAEVTMTFDNSRKTLNADAGEVQVARRVYRDGVGEYLLNGQICRLKDIKELFLGSGAGSGTYCIIEQGRVDALLQSSPKDRRAIFEEAAGISRFKAKKLETLRKLESTSLNLSRVKDILGEIEKQLRKIRAEAAKAQRWQEWSTRLRELRIGSGLREFRERHFRIALVEATVNALRAEVGQSAADVASWEGEVRELDRQLSQLRSELEENAEITQVARQSIVSSHADFKQHFERSLQLDGEIQVSRKKQIQGEFSLRNLQRERQTQEVQLAEAEAAAVALAEEADAHQVRCDKLEKGIADTLRTIERERRNQFELFQTASRLTADAEKRKGEWQRTRAEIDRHRRQIEQHRAERDSFDRGLENLQLTGESLQIRIASVQTTLSIREQERTELASQAEAIQRELADIRLKREGLRASLEVLENLEKTQEGLDVGTREVFERWRAPGSKLQDFIVGLVADLLNVPRPLAALVELALGDRSQCFVVRDAAILDEYLADPINQLPGRACFLSIANPVQILERTDLYLAGPKIQSSPLAPRDASGGLLPEVSLPDAQQFSAFISRSEMATKIEMVTLDCEVTCDEPHLQNLPKLLLGRTILVEDLAEARAKSLSLSGMGYRFLTKRRELLESDGTLIVGSRSGDTGIVSRKSELREGIHQRTLIERELNETEARQADNKKALEATEAPIHGLEHELGLLNHQAGDLGRAIEDNRRKCLEIVDVLELKQSELTTFERDYASLEIDWQRLDQSAAEARKAAEESTLSIQNLDRERKSSEEQRPALQSALTEARVRLGQCEVERNALREQVRKRLSEGEQLRESVERSGEEIRELYHRRKRALISCLEASSELAELYSRKEASLERSRELGHRRDRLAELRGELEERLRRVRGSNQKKLGDLHTGELELRDLVNAQGSLQNRIQEEYAVDLPELLSTAEEGPFADWLTEGVPVADWQTEIAELKEKIAKLGSVNLDSLMELQELEVRAGEIRSQYDDLTEARGSLLEIIQKINDDSQRMLSETLAAIKEHFQDIFKQLFGGGSADIVLDDPNDLLESGMEVVAKPPGKELRSISLMSGGEKTMTAVALLLAIFRSKPSPFCLLDEVDAALDEANSARLAESLREFTRQSQFIIITHKKRMMAVADALHGITMQESGVSKRVSIRFEDWAEAEQQQPRLAA